MDVGSCARFLGHDITYVDVFAHARLSLRTGAWNGRRHSAAERDDSGGTNPYKVHGLLRYVVETKECHTGGRSSSGYDCDASSGALHPPIGVSTLVYPDAEKIGQLLGNRYFPNDPAPRVWTAAFFDVRGAPRPITRHKCSALLIHIGQ